MTDDKREEGVAGASARAEEARQRTAAASAGAAGASGTEAAGVVEGAAEAEANASARPKVDLHVHTTVSDGSLTFEEVLSQAARLGIVRLAFTNHDTTAGLSQAAELGRRYGIQVIGGIEVSAYDFARKRKVHVLGYGLSEGAPALDALCSPVLDARRANTLWQLDQLLAAGYEVDVDRALTFGQASTCLYKQHLMAALIDEPHGSAAYKTLYRSLFKNGGIADRDITYVDARDAVRAIVEDGGIAVVAHPGQLDSYDFVPELVKCGLSGIELHHPDHTPVDRVRCMRLAERYGLFVTAGSDFHGAFGDIPRLGWRIPADFKDTLPL